MRESSLSTVHLNHKRSFSKNPKISNDKKMIEEKIKHLIKKYVLLFLILLEIHGIMIKQVKDLNSNNENENVLFFIFTHLMLWIDSEIILNWRSPFTRIDTEIKCFDFHNTTKNNSKGQNSKNSKNSKNTQESHFYLNTQYGGMNTNNVNNTLYLNASSLKSRKNNNWDGLFHFTFSLFAKLIFIIILILSSFQSYMIPTKNTINTFSQIPPLLTKNRENNSALTSIFKRANYNLTHNLNSSYAKKMNFDNTIFWSENDVDTFKGVLSNETKLSINRIVNSKDLLITNTNKRTDNVSRLLEISNSFSLKKWEDPMKMVNIINTGLCAPHVRTQRCLDDTGISILDNIIKDLNMIDGVENRISKCENTYFNNNEKNACLINSSASFFNKFENILNLSLHSAINSNDNKILNSLSENTKKLMSEKVQKYINIYEDQLDYLKSQYRPTRNKEYWKSESGITMKDMQRSMIQYEKVFPDFVLFPAYLEEIKKEEGTWKVQAIDYASYKGKTKLKEIDVKSFIESGKKQIGVIIGWIGPFSHAGSLYINIDKDDERFGFYHHESSAIASMSAYLKEIHQELESKLSEYYQVRISFPLKYNDVPKQIAKNDMECGVYSLYFLIKSLEIGKNNNMDKVYESIHPDSRMAMINLRTKTLFRIDKGLSFSLGPKYNDNDLMTKNS